MRNNGVIRTFYNVLLLVVEFAHANVITQCICQEFIAPDYETLDKQLEKQHGLDSHGSSRISGV